jgi:hypothetical protein
MAPMRAMPAMPPMPPMPRVMEWPMTSMHVEIGPQIERALHEAGLQLERVRPQIDQVLRDLPASLETIRIPTVRIDVDGDTLRPVVAPAGARIRTTIL